MSTSHESPTRRLDAKSRGRSLALAASLFVIAAAFLLYRDALGVVFDDHSLIGADGPLWVGGEWLPYRPLRHASFLVDHWIGGGAPWAYHLGNIALHAAAGLLVLHLCLRAGAASTSALVCTLAF